MSQNAVNRFNNLAGLTASIVSGGSEKQQRVYQAVDRYMQRLDQLMQAHRGIDPSVQTPTPRIDLGLTMQRPVIRVTPSVDRGFRYLFVENIGGSGEFQAQIDIVEGRDHWLEPGHWLPSIPYLGVWEASVPTASLKLPQGHTGRLSVMGLLPQGGDRDPHYLPQFSYFDKEMGYRFFGRRIDSLDEVEQSPLVMQVTIGSFPSMSQPFIAKYRLPVRGPLIEVT
jgi:hypothetical protein